MTGIRSILLRLTMVRWVMMRMFRHVLGVACGMVMQHGMFGFLREWLAYHIGQDRAGNHADGAGDESGKLRRDEGIIGS